MTHKQHHVLDTNKIAPPPMIDLLGARRWLEGTSGPLAVEVGCGVGLHPILYAQQNPTRRILAIERTTHKFLKFQRRLEHHDLNNIYGVQAEATRLLPHLLLPDSVDEFFFLYPNPYPKFKHRNLRWGNSHFMAFAIAALLPGGKITFATNIKSYADELCAQLPQLGVAIEAVTAVPKDSRRTHFEIKYLKSAQACYNLVFRKPT